jgi:hypothetical protein
MSKGAGEASEMPAGRKRVKFMGPPVRAEVWVSLRKRPPKEAMEAFVVMLAMVVMGFWW